MITVKNKSQIEKIRKSADILVEIMKKMKGKIKPGMKTKLFERKLMNWLRRKELVVPSKVFMITRLVPVLP